MENVYLKKLINMIVEVNRTENVEKKAILMNRTYSFGQFCFYSKRISSVEYIMAFSKLKDNSREKIVEEAYNRDYQNLIDNNEVLSAFYKKYLKLGGDFFNCPEVDMKSVYNSKYKIYGLFREFIKYMNCDRLYYSLLGKKKISFSSRLKYDFCIDDRYDSYILIHDRDQFNRYFSLSHELGHAYNNRVMCNRDEDFLPTYSQEIISLLFQRIFKEFINHDNKLSEKNKHDFNIWFESILMDKILLASYVTDVVKSGEYYIFDREIYKKYEWGKTRCEMDIHNYAIGNIVSMNLLNEWRKEDSYFIKHLPELIQFIFSLELDKLINQYDNEEAFTKEIKRLVK